MLVLGRADVEAVLEPRALIDALARAFAEHATGASRVPPRATVPVTDDGVLLLMPAVAPAGATPSDGVALGVKLVSFYAGNRARGVPTVHGTYVLMDGRTGAPLAFMDAGYLTGLRTGATSAVAARALARRDAKTLLCFGAGVQASFQLVCLAAEPPIVRVEVVGRDPERARRFAATWSERLGLPVTVTNDRDDAVARADVITCATTATTPLFDGGRLRPGVHVDGVGTFQPTARELDSETIRRARVVIDQPATVDNAGDIAIPIIEGVIQRSHVVGTLADVASGRVAGRTRADEITVFKSEGYALEDLVAARLAYTTAKARGVGRELRVEAASRPASRATTRTRSGVAYTRPVEPAGGQPVDKGRIVQISVSNGGVPKTAVPSARITEHGVDGDRQRDLEHHGGPERAVCLFSMERIRDLQGEGHAIVPGSAGENLTVEGIDWDAVQPNARILLGDDVALEVTRYTSPCVNIRSAFAGGNYARISQKRHAGWSRVYARVLAPGVVKTGDAVRVLPPPATP